MSQSNISDKLESLAAIIRGGALVGSNTIDDVSWSDALLAASAFLKVSFEYASDLNNTISSIEEEFPKTKKARMDRRMDLRCKFMDAKYAIDEWQEADRP